MLVEFFIIFLINFVQHFCNIFGVFHHFLNFFIIFNIFRLFYHMLFQNFKILDFFYFCNFFQFSVFFHHISTISIFSPFLLCISATFSIQIFSKLYNKNHRSVKQDYRATYVQNNRTNERIDLVGRLELSLLWIIFFGLTFCFCWTKNFIKGFLALTIYEFEKLDQVSPPFARETFFFPSFLQFFILFNSKGTTKIDKKPFE